MTRWQRRARLLLGAFALVFTAVLAFAIRERRDANATRSPSRADRNAMIESTGAVVTQLTGGRQSFQVRAERQLLYAGGATKLAGVTVTVNRPDGRSFTVTGREGEVGENQSTVRLIGDVRLAASDGLTATTEHVTYSDGDGIVRASGPVSFQKNRLSGSGVGMTYDKNQDLLWLLDRAVVKVIADAAGAGGLDISAGAVALDRRQKQLRFERSVRLHRDGQVVEADAATAFLTSDEQRVRAVELRGNSRVSGTGTEAGALQAMVARDMNLHYAENGTTLERAQLVWGAAIDIAGTAGARGRRIAGEAIDMVFAPDGATVTELKGRDGVQLELTAERDAPSGTIRARTLESSGEPGRGLTKANLAGDVEYRESGGSSRPGPESRRGPVAERIIRARTLDLALNPGANTIEEARFAGDVRFEEGQVKGTAAAARYLVPRGIVELGRGGDASQALPRVTDDRTAIEAEQIALTLEGRKIAARQNVRSVLQPTGRTGTRSPGKGAGVDSSAKVPGMLKDDQPVHVTGDDLAYDGAAGDAVYTGTARLWQRDTAVQADTISLHRDSGDLTATGAVRSTFMLEQRDEAAGTTERVTTIASARKLHYDGERRLASYTTSAHVSGSHGDLTADRVELYLADGDTLERAEAYIGVHLRSQGRVASGDRMTYFSADQRYVMVGTPVRIVEECRETTGEALTFFRSTDRIVVDGNKETRTQTKSGGRCREPHFD